MDDTNNSNAAPAAIAAGDDAETIAQAERLQGERFLQLSQRCHEQNWAHVHALAEQIVLHKPPPIEDKADDDDSKAKDGSSVCAVDSGGGFSDGNNQEAPNNPGKADKKAAPRSRRASREGTVSISGEIMHIDSLGSPTERAVGSGDGNVRRELIKDAGEVTSSNDDNSNIVDGSGGDNNEGATGSNNRNHPPSGADNNPSTNNKPSTAVAVPPSTPRMLSTCLGTASPLAWTCRYSAPSSTVKLVLDLDPYAVRRCLPQLGTPLHECVGRSRPLRKMPMKRGRWSNMVGNGVTKEATTTAAAVSSSSKSRNKKSKSSKKKKKHRQIPRILAGLREWRRTVRTLIQADEALVKEDIKYAAMVKKAKEAAEAAGNDDNKNSEEWRRTVQSMIKENVTNIKKYKNAAIADDPGSENKGRDDGSPERNGSSASGNNKPPSKQQPPLANNIPPVRATLAQDADGNTPLHFMIRGAAAPAFGGGRWQARHEVDEEDYGDDDDDDDDDDNDDQENNEDAMDVDNVDSSAGEDASSDAAAPDGNDRTITRNNNGNDRGGRDLRHIEYLGTSGSSWDGVRWCMEAHLRRVERRMARQMRWKEKMNERGGGGDEDDDPDASASDGGVARCVASVHIGSPMSGADEDMPDGQEDDAKPRSPETAADSASAAVKLPAKRKSLDEDSVKLIRSNVKSSRVVPSSLSGGAASLPTQHEEKKSSQSHHHHGKRSSSRRKKKYLDADECQDCTCDPLLGAVRDLVHSCPEAVGTPDHREYEETPLIVALKSSIYVVMEPDNDFQLVERVQGADGGIAMLHPGGGPGGRPVGDGFAIFGGGMLNGGAAAAGMIGGAAGMGGGAFPFPELGALMHNRPFNIFPDDEAMMAVLRGHGRRVTRDNTRRRSSAAAARRAASAANPPSTAGGVKGDENVGGESELKKEGGDNEDDDSTSCSSVSDDSSFDGEDDPRYDAFVPSSNEQIVSFGREPPGVQLGLLPRRRPRYDYQTALEYRIFCLVRIMLDVYPRAACLMISDYTPLHSAVFHGRCPDTIRLLLDAEARFSSSPNNDENQARSQATLALRTPTSPEPCPTLSGPAMLCTNTRGELPLHFASMRNECARSIRLLAEADPRAALVRDASGRTPLRWLWIRFVDGLLDRFGGRDTQREDDDGMDRLAFQEQEGGNTRNFPNPGQSVLGGMMSQGREVSMNDAFSNGGCSQDERADVVPSSGAMFVFDTEYLRRTRNIDRTVDFLRMRHVPSGFENIEYVAAEHAITVLLKLKYLQQRRNRQLEAAYGSARGSGDNGRLPPDVPMSTKEEFILYAFEKFTALIYAALVASEAEERIAAIDAARGEQVQSNDDADSDFSVRNGIPSRKKLWHSLPRVDSNKKFYLVHEACGGSRASCPAAVAKICIKLFSDQLFQRDDDGRLPLHRVACRGLGWEPPGSDIDTSHVSLADETLTLLKEVLSGSHERAPESYDNNRQLPLHCAVDSLVTSLVMGKRRRASLHAEARVALQKYRHTHVEIAMECLSELLHANSSALQRRDGKTGLYPFMQAALPHVKDCAVVKYTSDLSRRPGFDVGVGYHSMERDVVEENDIEAESDHLTIIYHLLREDPSVIIPR
ncbi:hypothetical protein ACHAXR_010300 [Thalassiosira sp. AJA248-18]